ncbi:uncharacterized protein LOC128165710 [Crassostrea angulata]|uniref:uncharacterized protein LOC128165710 n=1 Tax=Magallana angulata TaxID=2784310 RepID=UPI0022B09A0F|nr:uncharacterized protein LOC128165710 [Crassostrea angulata]
MSNGILNFVIGTILIFHLSAYSWGVKIFKPDTCDKKHTWFLHGKTYHYLFTAISDSGFVGASESKAGFKYTCRFSVDVARKCEGLLKIDHCDLYDRQPGADVVYNKSAKSDSFSKQMSKNSVYFQYHLGEVNREGIVTSEVEDPAILNIKRAILSSLQLRIMPVDQYDKQPHQQTDIFGACPTDYKVSECDPDVFYTERNLRLCEMPQIYSRPMNILSMIQKPYGGYKIGKVLEAVYPFSSTVKCKHEVNRRHQLKMVNCLQQQIFEPTAYNGSVYASYMTNISQSLELKEVVKLDTRSVNRRIRGKKYVDILFEFETKNQAETTTENINNVLHQLVDGMKKDNMEEVPGLYHQLVYTMKNSNSKTLLGILKDILNCHGNNTVNCDSVYQYAEKDYFLDGLLSCGTHDCLEVFADCLKNGQVYDPIISSLFSYDLAINHKPSPEILSVLFDVCKNSSKFEHWLPLSIMVQRFLQETHTPEFQQDHIIMEFVSHIAHEIGYTCQSDMWQLLDAQGKESKHDHLILMFKVLGNIGSVIQKFPSLSSQVDKIIKSTLLCVETTEIPYHLSKSALQAISTLNATADIRSSLLTVLYDIRREASLRTQAFVTLAETADEDLLTTLLDVLHTDPMDYMRMYMTSFIEGVMENEQPDRQGYRDLWKKVLKKDGRHLPSHYSFLVGRSLYIDLSRYFKLPLSSTFQGLQLELDMVYDPLKPSYQSTVIKLNYFNGKKHNILEVGTDMRGLVLQDGSKSYQGIFSMISLFKRIKDEVDKSDSVNPKEMFGNFHTELVQEIRGLFQRINYQGDKEALGGLLHLKVFGHEVAYVEAERLLELLSVKYLTTKGHEFLEVFMFHFNKGYNRIKTRSSQIMDLTKVLPTVSGASLNMTVLVLHTSATEVKAKLSLENFLLGLGPLETLAHVSHQGAFEFLGQMTVTLPSLACKKARMVTRGVLRGALDVDAMLTAFKPSIEVLEHFKLTLFSRNDGMKKEFAFIKNKMVLMHGDEIDIEEVPFLPNYHGKFERCYAWSPLTDQEVCVSADYPNVTSSTSHAYFPLSGPSFASIFRKNSTFRDMKLTADYQKKKESIDIEIIIDTTGYTGNQVFNLTFSDFKGPFSSFTAQMKTPSKNFKFDWINDRVISRVNGTKVTRKTRGITIETQGQHFYGIILKDNDTHVFFNLNPRNLSLEVFAPEFKLEMNLETYFHYRYKFLKIQRKLFCTKKWPLLYPLHINTKFASENGDKSVLLFKFEEKKNYINVNNTRNQNFSIHFGYPGQDIETEIGIKKSNGSLTDVEVEVSYLGQNQSQECLLIGAKIEEQDESTGGGYQYSFVVEQRHKYQVIVSTKVKDFSREIGADFNLTYKLLGTNDDFREKTTEIQKFVPDPDCRRLGLLGQQKVTMRAKVTGNIATLRLKHGPGVNIDYKMALTYPLCNNYIYLIGEGNVGKLVKGNGRNYWQWFTSSFLYGTHKEANIPREDLNTSVATHFNLTLKSIFDSEYEHSLSILVLNNVDPSWFFNVSYMFQFLRNAQNKSDFFQLKSHQDTPWQFVNYHLEKNLALRRNNISRWWIELLTNFSNSYWSLNDNLTVIVLNNTSSLDYNATVRSKISFIPLIVTYGLTGKKRWGEFPDLQLYFSPENAEYSVTVNFITPSRLNITVTSEVKANKSHLLTLDMELTGPTQLTNTLHWDADKASIPLKLRGLGVLKGIIAQSLLKASGTMMTNLRKPLPEKDVPFLNMTVREFFEDHLKPFLHTVPFTNTLNGLLQCKLNLNNATGSIFYWHMDVYIAKLFKLLGSSLTNTPSIFLGTSDNLQRIVVDVLTKGKLVWVTPIPVKLSNFFRSELGIGQRYIKYLASVSRSGELHSSNHVARIENFRNIKTFDGNAYTIPVSDLGCKHLLTADFQQGKFAVVLSVNEISLLTVTQSVTVDAQGRLFLGDCDTPVTSFPQIQREIQIERRSNKSIHIKTDYGVSLTFNIVRNDCRLELTSKFRNQTLGLLGNPDSEKGTDWRNPDGEIMINLGQFLPDYALGHPKYCHQLKEPQDVSHLYKEVSLANPKVIPVEIVLVALETTKMAEGLDSVLLDFIKSLKKRFTDINIGVLISGSKNIINPHQYFMDAKLINSTTLEEIWRTEITTEASLLLNMAASYPYRTHSHKMILLLSPNYDVLNDSSSRDLNTLFDQRKITLYMASNYARFKKNVLGVGWDSAAIMHQSRRYIMMSFPKSEVADILEDTLGALFDLEPIMSRDLSKIDTLSKYLHEESSRNSQCLQI